MKIYYIWQNLDNIKIGYIWQLTARLADNLRHAKKPGIGILWLKFRRGSFWYKSKALASSGFRLQASKTGCAHW